MPPRATLLPCFPFFLTILLSYTATAGVRAAKDEKDPSHPCTYQGQHILVQDGIPRTGSTWQHQAVCRSLQLVTVDVNGKADYYLNCAFVSGHSLDAGEKLNDFVRSARLSPQGANAFHVLKSHSSWDQTKAVPDSLVFASQRGLNDFPNSTICYRQLYAEFINKGLFELEVYRNIFSLTEAQYDVLRYHMRYWEIIRKCCGPQASVDWRKELLEKKPLTYPKHEAFALDAPQCRMYNLTKVEELYELSPLVEQERQLIHQHKMSKPHEAWYRGPGYCKLKVEKSKNLGKDHRFTKRGVSPR